MQGSGPSPRNSSILRSGVGPQHAPFLIGSQVLPAADMGTPL